MKNSTGIGGEYLILKETAKIAKEKGFNKMHSDFYIDRVANGGFTDLPCVPQTLIQQWLREEHKIDLWVEHYCPSERYYYQCPQLKLNAKLNHWGDTYEEALEKGLQEALKLIKI